MVCYFSPPPGGLAFADLFPAGVPDLAPPDLASCDDCGSSVQVDSMTTAQRYHYGRACDPVSVCESCATLCDYCGETYGVSQVDSVSVPRRPWPPFTYRDLSICAACFDRLARCSECSAFFDLEEGGGVVDYDHLCSDCLDRLTHFCQSCDSYTRGDFCGECDSCDDCGCDNGCPNLEASNDQGDLLPYDHKPDPVFYGTGPLFLGFELEMECGDAPRDRGQIVRSISSGLERVYLKHDGSLVDGIELVTHPMSPASLVEWWPTFSSTLDDLRSEGVRSWNGHRCGFHVHMSRDAFHGPRHLFAFALFVYRNADQMRVLSGRRQAELDAYARLNLHQGDGMERHHGDARLIEKVRNSRYGGARHVAVNLTNRSTVEVRLFRGSLRHETLRGYLDLVLAVFEYSAGLTVRDIHGGALNWHNFREWVGGPFGSFPALVDLERTRSRSAVS